MAGPANSTNIVTLLPEADNARIAKVGGPGKEFWVFGKNYPNEMNPPDPEKGGWRIEVSPVRPSASDRFLNVRHSNHGITARIRIRLR